MRKMNKTKIGLRLLVMSGLLLLISGCCNGNTTCKTSAKQDDTNEITKAVCVMTPTEGNTANGIVTFTRTDAGILIVADIKGLSTGKHGFHVHQYGDISKLDGTSAGGHFNPEGVAHAGHGDKVRHVGDFGNIVADENGNAHYEELDTLIAFSGKHNIIGRAIIIHAGEDDLVSQPTGNAGKRAAYGVIGTAK